MIWAVSGVTFVAIVLIILALVYAFSTGTLPVTERLGRLWQPPSRKEDLGFREKQKEKVQRVLTDVGKLVPGTSKQVSHVQRLMIRAGYRKPEAVLVIRGVKLLLPIGLLALVYFTGVYQENPFFILIFA